MQEAGMQEAGMQAAGTQEAGMQAAGTQEAGNAASRPATPWANARLIDAAVSFRAGFAPRRFCSEPVSFRAASVGCVLRWTGQAPRLSENSECIEYAGLMMAAICLAVARAVPRRWQRE